MPIRALRGNMMKKIVWFVLTMMLTLCACGAMAASVSDLTFAYDDIRRTAEITDCNTAAAGDLEIPKTVAKGVAKYTVTGIRDRAFFGCTGLKSVTIPESVKSIGNLAFSACYGLKSVAFSGMKPPVVEHTLFWACNKIERIEVPIGREEAYRTALQKASYNSINPEQGPYCAELVVGCLPPQPDDQEPAVKFPAPQQSAEVAELPKTGDASRLGAWLFLLGMSAAGMKLRRKNG